MITVRLGFPAALLLVAACAGTKVRWHPSFVWHVPDSTEVRFAVGPSGVSDSLIRGLSVGWQRGTPRLVTPRGDTIAVPAASRPEVRLPYTARHTKEAGAIGFLIGGLTITADCGFEKTCGEQDPRAIIGLAVGVLIGSLIETENWVRVKWH